MKMKIMRWLCPGNWFTFLFSLQIISGLRHAKRERERELPIHLKPIAPQHQCRQHPSTGVAIQIAPQHWCRHLDRHHPRLIHPKLISSASTLPISFSFLTQCSSTPSISSSQSHRTNDLVISISSPMTNLVAHGP